VPSGATDYYQDRCQRSDTSKTPASWEVEVEVNGKKYYYYDNKDNKGDFAWISHST
jgi:hypothetical protein